VDLDVAGSNPVTRPNFFMISSAGSASEHPMAKTKKTAKPTRSTLAQAAAIGQESTASGAKFIGWTKLPGTARVMAGRFADGTIVYRGKDKVWIFGKPAKAA
jgi:hypothetical protein